MLSTSIITYLDDFVIVAFLSCLIVLFAIPPIITVANTKHLFDAPGDDRKIHKVHTPNLGGVAIFTGFVFTCSLFVQTSVLPYYNYILASAIILFVIGLKDDLIGMEPFKKFFAQFVSAVILIVFANIRITSLYGIFGVEELPYIVSVAISILTIIVITNAFNLIDGIDGLAGSIGCIVTLSYGVIFCVLHEFGLALLAFSLFGALVGFLYYNVSPARIFMGDTGSLLLGMVASILTIMFIELENTNTNQYRYFFESAPGIAVGILIIPLFDTLRVFTLRLARSESPFKADRNHLHHRLIDLHYSHTQAVLILVMVNVIFILLALTFQAIGNQWLLVMLLVFVIILNMFMTARIKNKAEAGPAQV